MEVSGNQHTWVKPEKIASLAVGVLQRELIVPRLMWQWAATDFAYAQNDTVTIKVPGSLTARERKLRAQGEARKIQMDYLTESKIGVQLTEFPYSAVQVTDEELSLDIADFGSQVLAPQMRALAEKIEDMSVQLLVNATYADGVDEAGSEAAKFKGTLKAEDFFGAGKNGMFDLFARVRTTLNVRNVPQNNRVVVMGPGFEELLVTEPQLVRYSESGDSSALRDARVGRLAGFDFVVSNAVPMNEAYVFHKTAFVLATGTAGIPTGAVAGATTAHEGIALRWLRDYDADYAIDRSVVDCFAGTGTITDGGKLLRAMKITADPAKVLSSRAGGSASK